MNESCRVSPRETWCRYCNSVALRLSIFSKKIQGRSKTPHFLPTETAQAPCPPLYVPHSGLEDTDKLKLARLVFTCPPFAECYSLKSSNDKKLAARKIRVLAWSRSLAGDEGDPQSEANRWLGEFRIAARSGNAYKLLRSSFVFVNCRVEQSPG